MRWISALALAATMALAFTVSVSGDAEAAKKKPAVSKSKLCKATTIDNKKVSFRCKASESCCYDGLMAKGNCAPAGQVCF
jgi:hypothetical protein